MTTSDAMTLRYDAGAALGSAAIIEPEQKEVAVSAAPAGTYLVVQNDVGAWAKAVSGNSTVSASDFTGASLSSFADCKVWLEITNADRITTATMATGKAPTIIIDSSANHQIASGKDMTYTCSGKLEELEGIYVDGKLVDPSNYTLKSGSTILTLKASYLDTLSVGKHTLKFQYKDNVSAETDFTITAKAGGTLTALLARRRRTGRHYSK